MRVVLYLYGCPVRLLFIYISRTVISHNLCFMLGVLCPLSAASWSDLRPFWATSGEISQQYLDTATAFLCDFPGPTFLEYEKMLAR